MKFGKSLQQAIEESQPEFQDKFLCYKTLKKTLKNISDVNDEDAPSDVEHVEEKYSFEGLTSIEDHSCREKSNGLEAPDYEDTDAPHFKSPLTQDEENFVKLLNEEVQKFNEFYMQKEEEFVIVIQNIEEQLKRALEVAVVQELNQLRAAFVKFHGKMVLLQNWSALNYAALVKILKKHDKRTKLALRSRFLYNVLWQPFYCTEVISELISRAESGYSQIESKQKSLEDGGLVSSGEVEKPQLLEMQLPHEELDKDVQDLNPSMMKQTQTAIQIWLQVKSNSVPVPEGETIKSNKRPAAESNPDENKVKEAKKC